MLSREGVIFDRQIRKMCSRVGLKVTDLQRVRIGPVRMGELEEGKWRELSAEEIESLRRAVKEAGGK